MTDPDPVADLAAQLTDLAAQLAELAAEVERSVANGRAHRARSGLSASR